jgi:hypothetical protein
MMAARVDVAVDIARLLTRSFTSRNDQITPPKFLTSFRGSS